MLKILEGGHIIQVVIFDKKSEIVLRILSILKYKITNFFKRGLLHSNVLFQMRLISNFSITLIQSTIYIYIGMRRRNGIWHYS